MNKRILLIVLWAGTAFLLEACMLRQRILERKVFMPVITRLDGDLRGVEVWPGSHHLEDLQELRPALVRTYIYWSEGELWQGDYRVDPEVIRIIALAHQAGARVMLTVKAAPVWAGGCEGIRWDQVDAFEDFWAWAVKRYEAEAFEFWNEPDAGVGDYPYYGGWSGGGEYYGEIASILAPITHQAGKQFVIGAVGDPGNPFLGDALRQIEPGAVDLVSYHFHPGIVSMDALDEHLEQVRKVWKGGVILGETSLVWDEAWGGRTEAEHRKMQAQYYQVLFMWSQVNQVAFVWYGLDDPVWRWAGLYDTQDQRTPTWWEFRGKKGIGE